MEEVTDVAFREMFAKYSKQQTANGRQQNSFVMFTEFLNVDGLLHPEGYKKLKIDLAYTENQRPIVAQLWGADPEKFYRAAQLIASLKFDGVDINMGCPQSKEIGLGACAALIRNPGLAKEIIAATKEGAGGLPVSVKTRLGYSGIDEMEEWVSLLLGLGITALTLHGRTKKEMSKVPAHWDKIKEAVEVRDKMQEKSNKQKTLIIGNGDIKSYREGLDKAAETKCDGIMVGRGAFGAPYFFRADGYQPSIKERMSVMLEHAGLFEEKLGGIKSFMIMRKHFKAYAGGFAGSAELRGKLMETKNLREVRDILEKYPFPV